MSVTENQCESKILWDDTSSGARNIGDRLDEAESELGETESKFGAHSEELLPILDKVAQLYQCDGLFAKAELLYRRSVDILNGVGDQGARTVEALFRLGALYRAECKLDDAEAVYLRGLAVAEQSCDVADNKRNYAERMCCLAGLYYEKGEYAQSEQLLVKASAIFNEVFGDNNYFSRLGWLGLAAVCRKLGRSGDADEYVARAAYAQTATSAPGEKGRHSNERAIIELTRLYFAQSRYAEVDQLLMPALFSEEEKIWPAHPRVAQYLHDRGELFRAQGQFEEAQVWLERALQIRLEVLGNAHAEVGMTAMNLAVMLLAQNRYAEAEPVLKLALKTRVRAFGVEHPSVAACIETYSALLKRTKRMPIAQKLDARARDIRSKLVWQSERGTVAARPYPAS
jgi:tetratricopeptide (TPR) repeat protein